MTAECGHFYTLNIDLLHYYNNFIEVFKAPQRFTANVDPFTH
jgi:hypothetical protein